MPERIQLRRTKGWRKPEGAVVVARPSKWGNPFRVSGKPSGGGTVYGLPWFEAREVWGRQPKPAEYALYISCSRYRDAVDGSVRTFWNLISVRQRDEPERFASWIAPLRGRDLACWCPLGSPCHADVLLEVANA